MRTKLVVAFTVLAVLLGVGGVAAFRMLGDDTAAAAGPGKPVALELSPPSVLTGDPIAIVGTVAPEGRRVLLERLAGEQWMPAGEMAAGAKGAFSFEVTATEQPASYRVLAPAGTVEGANRERTSPAIEVRASEATGALVLRPAIGQSKDGEQELMPGIATFTPAKEGAEVTIEEQRGGSWRTVADGEQDERGEFAFLLDATEEAERPALRAMTTHESLEDPIYTGAVTSSPWKPAWNDEFDGTALGPEWQVFPTSAAAKRTCATVIDENIVVGGGKVDLTVTRDPNGPRTEKECPDGQFFNAQIGTAGKTFTYGVISARVKFQEPRGMHAGVWMYPWGEAPADVPETDLPGHRGVEVDILEYFGDDYSDFDAYRSWVYFPTKGENGEIVSDKRGGRPEISKIKGDEELSEDWHVVSVEWTPEGYIYRFDGVEFQRIDDGVSRRPQKLLLSLFTSDYEIERMRPGSLPGLMQVDWVRVWQK